MLDKEADRINQQLARKVKEGVDEAKKSKEDNVETSVEAKPEESKEEVMVEKKDDEMELDEETMAMVMDKISKLEEESLLVKQLRRVDVVEVYSPPRVSKTAEKHGLKAGEAMDLLTGWDFTLERHRRAAIDYVNRVKPLLIIGSPECTMFSSLQNLNKKNWSKIEEEKLVEAKRHIKFVVELYKIQVKEGRYFLHEHPAGASSWALDDIKDLEKETGVKIAVADQCMYGLKTYGKDKKVQDKAARKRTKFMTNSQCMAEELSKRCRGEHAHQALEGGRAKEARIYPEELCEAMVRGVIRQMEDNVESLRCLMTVKATDSIWQESEGLKARSQGGDHEEDWTDGLTNEAWDDVTGGVLDKKEVVKARLKELEYVKDKEVWVKIPRWRAKQMGIKVIGGRWIDVNKGDDKCWNYRSRFVAKEFNTGSEEGVFAATPPLEALRLLLSEAATIEETGEERVMMINDVARAFFEAPARRKICVEMPDEAKTQEDWDEDNVALLQKSLYGTRDAAANFQAEVRHVMKGLGFKVGRYNPSTYHHEGKQLMTLVHGDDFVTVGKREDVKWFKEKLEGRFEIKTKTIGRGGQDEVTEAKVLNRVIRVTDEGWEYEADQRHAELIIKTLKLESSKPVTTPGEEQKPWLEEEEEKPLEGEAASEYRALAARGNYLALDRPDIQYPVKELCRAMSRPTVGDRRKLKRLGRYLVGRPRVVAKYAYQHRPGQVDGFTDSDWAGCRRTAKSTSGGVIRVGRHFIKSWSSTQKSITLSSGEAELVAAVKMCSETIGFTQLAEDWGLTMEGRVWVDSSAAIGTMHRRGNGKLRHVRVGSLWVQERVEEGELRVDKVAGEDNPADLCTKHLTAKKIDNFMRCLDFEYREGRAETSLEL